MMNIKLLYLFFFLFSSLCTSGQIELPRLISDGMVLQRDMHIKLWGWASPGEEVTLTFRKKSFRAITDQENKWEIKLPPQPAGGPHEMNFSASNSITLKNILFGDVWVCSGQSNMELTMERVRDEYADVIAEANNSNIRQFEVSDRYNFNEPNEDIETGKWISVNSQDILKFSAVAYFFARDLYSKYKIPIGLINSALGGSPAEAWISEEAIKKFPSYYEELQKFKDPQHIIQIENTNNINSSKWYRLLNESDPGLKYNWYDKDFNDADWRQMTIPGYWAHQGMGEVNGSVWFRKEVTIPEGLTNRSSRLLLGRVVDADSVYINGVFVGTTSYQYPPRKYAIPTNILKGGENIIAIRVISTSGRGGFVPDKPYKLVLGADSIDLTGHWKVKPGASMTPMPGHIFVRWKPTGLFNAMIAPLVKYSIKGVIWYQGESNTDKPEEYTSLMQTLISDWRTHWKQGQFPFLMVQLTNFMEAKDQPNESNWAALRQAQLNTLAVPNTGLAVAIDAGEWNDIHPLNKQIIGERLALQARKIAYNDQQVVATGPLYHSVKRKGNKLFVTFKNTGSGLTALHDPELKHFAIADEDNRFVWAKARIEGDQVVVWHESISRPVAIRYAWADNPEGANLYNEEGLPAFPFEARVEKK